MKNKQIFLLFIIFASLQLMVPLTGVVMQEMVLKNGELYKFRTEPIDPYDPFRGKYVTLSVKDDITVDDEDAFERKQKVYAVIEKAEDGFAYVAKLEKEKPQGNNYIETKITSAYSKQVHFDMPFKRYYLDEKKAPQAEKYYREHNRGDKQDAYITVRLKNGKSALEELYISELPVLDFIQQAIEKEKQSDTEQ